MRRPGFRVRIAVAGALYRRQVFLRRKHRPGFPDSFDGPLTPTLLTPTSMFDIPIEAQSAARTP